MAPATRSTADLRRSRLTAAGGAASGQGSSSSRPISTLLREHRRRCRRRSQIADRAGYSGALGVRALPDTAMPAGSRDRPRASSMWQRASAVPRDGDGDRADRACARRSRTRARTCERWLPLWRALNANQGESAEFQDADPASSRETIVKRLELMYAAGARRPCRTTIAGKTADRAGGADRRRKLGADARILQPVVRRGLRGVGQGHRPPAAADADAGGDVARTDGRMVRRPQASSVDRWPPLRSERTRQFIIEAYLSLLSENQRRRRPLLQIAERAGYSVRSVFERFPDLACAQPGGDGLCLRPGQRQRQCPQHRRRPRRRASGPMSRRAAGSASSGCRCGGALNANQGDSERSCKQRIRLIRQADP